MTMTDDAKRLFSRKRVRRTHEATVRVIDMLHEELEQNVTEEEKNGFYKCYREDEEEH